jgi:hypothetical protein
MFNSWSTSVNPNGLSFAAQPPVFAKDVRLQLLTSAIVVAPSSRVLIKRRLDASGPSLAQMNVRFYLPSPQPKVNTPNAPQPESDHMTLAHGVTITAPPPSKGELVLCGGEGHAAVPPSRPSHAPGGRDPLTHPLSVGPSCVARFGPTCGGEVAGPPRASCTPGMRFAMLRRLKGV